MNENQREGKRRGGVADVVAILTNTLYFTVTISCLLDSSLTPLAIGRLDQQQLLPSQAANDVSFAPAAAVFF